MIKELNFDWMDAVVILVVISVFWNVFFSLTQPVHDYPIESFLKVVILTAASVLIGEFSVIIIRRWHGVESCGKK